PVSCGRYTPGGGRPRPPVRYTFVRRQDRMRHGPERLRVALAFALVCVGASFVGPRDAAAVLAELSDDAYTTAGSARAFGAAKILRVGGAQKTFIKFNLSTLPPGTTGSDVMRAMLMVYVDALRAPGSLDVRQVTSSWSEATIRGSSEPTLGDMVGTAVPVTGKNEFVAV